MAPQYDPHLRNPLERPSQVLGETAYDAAWKDGYALDFAAALDEVVSWLEEPTGGIGLRNGPRDIRDFESGQVVHSVHRSAALPVSNPSPALELAKGEMFGEFYDLRGYARIEEDILLARHTADGTRTESTNLRRGSPGVRSALAQRLGTPPGRQLCPSFVAARPLDRISGLACPH